MERFCVFDIETAPLADAEVYLPLPKPRANLKDPVKIEADIREKTATLLDRAALDPDLCRIVAAGWDCNGTAESAVCEDASQERLLLERFWRQSQGTTLVEFNCLSFDLPVLPPAVALLGGAGTALLVEQVPARQHCRPHAGTRLSGDADVSVARVLLQAVRDSGAG